MGKMKELDIDAQEAARYTEKGHESREHYLLSLAESYGLPMRVVWEAAQLHGPEEDFDGLVSFLNELPTM
jgi:hypothetical protein